jgi:hypothetical protein
MKIKLGHIKFIDNTKRKFGSNDNYIAFWVTTESGVKSKMILTEHEYQVATNRASENPEDMPKLNKGIFQTLAKWFSI